MSKAPAWRVRCALGFMTGAGALLIANAALAAETCDGDVACPHGFVCTTFQAPTCPARDCASDDEECAKTQPECEAHEIKQCTAAPCTENADCADDMVCYQQTETTCSGGKSLPPCASDDGCEAEKPESSMCETKSFAACVPRYVPPCKEDADCGEGFLCKEQLSVSCSGSAGKQGGAGGKGSDPADGGPADAGAPEPEPPTCTTEPSGVFYCELQQVSCEEATDCPKGFSCESVSEGSVCAGASTRSGSPSAAGSTPDGSAPDGSAPDDGAPDDSAPDGSAADGGAAADAAPHETTACEEPMPAKKLCLPPYAKYGYGTQGHDSRAELSTGSTANGGSTLGLGKDGSPQAAPSQDGTTAADPAAKACAVDAVGASRGGRLGLLALLPFAVVAFRRRRSGRTRGPTIIS